jgi:acyl carrier protein
MAPPHPPLAAPLPVAKGQDRASSLVATARAGFERFKAGGDTADLDAVVVAMLKDYAPRRSASAVRDAGGGMRLVDDLGLDSLAVTEMVFFAEDLFGISITNQEIAEVRTVDDLRLFIRQKVAASLKP